MNQSEHHSKNTGLQIIRDVLFPVSNITQTLIHAKRHQSLYERFQTNKNLCQGVWSNQEDLHTEYDNEMRFLGLMAIISDIFINGVALYSSLHTAIDPFASFLIVKTGASAVLSSIMLIAVGGVKNEERAHLLK